jgi:hypothetical protein
VKALWGIGVIISPKQSSSFGKNFAFIHALYEWINPITDQPSGAFPFRTGISSIRLALFDIIYRNNL